MAQKSFSIGEAINFGWVTTKKNLKFLALTFFIIFIVNILFSSMGKQNPRDPGFPAIISLIGRFVEMLMGIGVIVIALKLIDKKKPDLKDLYRHYNLLIKYFLGTLLYGLIVGAIPATIMIVTFVQQYAQTFKGAFSFPVISMVLLILSLPVVLYLAIRYSFYSYFIVDKKMGPIEAIKASGKVTKGNMWHLVGFGIVEAGVVILGALALGVGLLVAVPVVSIATAYIYRKLAS